MIKATVNANTRHVCRQRYTRRLLAFLIFGFTSGFIVPVRADLDDDLFEHYEIVTGIAKHPTVITGFFLGGDAAEIVVISVAESYNRRLQMYGFDGAAWASVLETTLSPDVLFVDVASIGGHDRLITFEPGRLNWFDPDSAAEKPFLDVTTNYSATNEHEIPQLDITRDINRDGLDDIVLPDVDGFWTATQLGNGSFTTPVKLGPPEPYRDETAWDDARRYGNRRYGEVGLTVQTNPWYQSRVHEMDYNRDGLSDLVFWNGDHFDVHLQDERGLFNRVSETFTTDVPFDSDGVYSYAFGFSGDSRFSLLLGFRKKTTRTVLHSIRDINGDGIADLVTLSLEGRSVVRQRSLYEVHFGLPVFNATVFERDVGTSIRPPGKPTALGYSLLSFHQSGAEGEVDARLGHVNTGIGQISRVLFANTIAIDLAIYRTHEGVFPDNPIATRSIKPASDTFGPRGPFFPAVLVGDVSGDGREDLLVGNSRKELHVYRGVPEPELFARNAQSVAVNMPDNELHTRLVDLTRDGKQDLLVHYPSPTDPHRVKILIAR